MGMETPEILDYRSDNDFDKEPKKINGDGDGTVNEWSLSATCERWVEEGHDVTISVYSDVDHVGTIQDDRIIEQVITLTCNN